MIFFPNSRPDTRIVRWTGFTLTELTLLVAIISILAVIAMPVSVKARDNSPVAVIDRNLREVNAAKWEYAVRQNKATAATVSDLTPLSVSFRRGRTADVK